MIKEIALLKVDPSEANAFEQTYKDLVHILQRQPGYIADKLYRAIERPEEYILEVEWGSVADHERFISAEDYPDLDGELGAFIKDASIAHYQHIS